MSRLPIPDYSFAQPHTRKARPSSASRILKQTNTLGYCAGCLRRSDIASSAAQNTALDRWSSTRETFRLSFMTAGYRATDESSEQSYFGTAARYLIQS